MKIALVSAILVCLYTSVTFSSKEVKRLGPKKMQKREDFSTHSSELQYLRRLKKYSPPKHVDLGLRDFRIPQRNIYRGAGGLGDKGVARKKNISSSSTSGKTRRINKRRKGRTSSSTSTESSSSTSHTDKRTKIHRHNPKRQKKTWYHGKKLAPRKKIIVESSSSSSRRSVSLDICFSQEDAAILGSRSSSPSLFAALAPLRKLSIFESQYHSGSLS